MCNFVDQFGNVVRNVVNYGVDGSRIDPGVFPRKCRPHDRISLVHPGPDGPVLEDGNWGMHLPGFAGITTNARDDRLETSSLWRSMWGSQHVVVPVSHGYEKQGSVWHCIQRPDGEPWYVAGLGRVQEGKHRTQWHVSMVTTDAGPVFGPIHETGREVVCLRDWNEVETWLGADKEACRQLIRPATPDVLASHRVHPDVLREGFPQGKWPEPWQGIESFGT